MWAQSNAQCPVHPFSPLLPIPVPYSLFFPCVVLLRHSRETRMRSQDSDPTSQWALSPPPSDLKRYILSRNQEAWIPAPTPVQGNRSLIPVLGTNRGPGVQFSLPQIPLLDPGVGTQKSGPQTPDSQHPSILSRAYTGFSHSRPSALPLWPISKHT